MKYVLVCFLLIPLKALAEEKFELPVGISQDEWNQHLKIEAEIEQDRRQRYESELKSNPPAPPWIKYPEQSRDSLFWRMGVGETYLQEYVLPYLNMASGPELETYWEKYPEPEAWEGWYDGQ